MAKFWTIFRAIFQAYDKFSPYEKLDNVARGTLLRKTFSRENLLTNILKTAT